MISFGVLPAMVVYKLWDPHTPSFLPLVSFSIAAFSAIRLAIFNLDDSQSDSFRGLPTPANAVLLTALPFQPVFIMEFIQQPGVLILIIMLSSFLLVAPMELFALKFKTFNWTDNKIRFTFLILSVLLLGFLRLAALPLIIILYIGLSLGVRAFSR
jgi:CDP-diacylglycerol--serine O-phosphatidyltransferase